MIFTMCPVAATQRMFSGCGDRDHCSTAKREHVPSARIWQPRGPVLTHPMPPVSLLSAPSPTP